MLLAGRPVLSPPQPLIDRPDALAPQTLRSMVEAIAYPRHAQRERMANEAVAGWISDYLTALGYSVSIQGNYRNVVATSPQCAGQVCTLVGAHYDTVPYSPGADDNASAVVAMLTCARLLAESGSQRPVVFVAFNNEEDGHLGSDDYVYGYLTKDAPYTIGQAHILEMVGYCSREPHSQTLPKGLPIHTRLPHVGDFIALLANRGSRKMHRALLRAAPKVAPDLHVVGVRSLCGLETFFPVLWRSDHAAFWHAGIPAVMWTDTAEYRNPHYHAVSDIPDTLDYDFMGGVIRLLTGFVEPAN